MKKQTRVDFANTLRGFAALAVLIDHYFGVFWLDRPTISSYINAPILTKTVQPVPDIILWFSKIPLFDLGAYGVALFFIISGFVIPFALMKQTWSGFFVNRLFRLFPTYFFGFSITLIGIWLSTRYFSFEWPYTYLEVFIHYFPGIRDIFQSRYIDGIVWTLEIEIKFYILCMLSIVWFRRESVKVFLIPPLLFFSSLCLLSITSSWKSYSPTLYNEVIVYKFFAQYIIFMFIGVALNYLFRGIISAEKAFLLSATLFAMFCIDWQTGQSSYPFYNAWSYGFAVLTFIFAYNYPVIFKSNKVFDFLADISYPLYVMHGLAGYSALRILLDAGMNHWIALFLVSFAAIYFSWLIHKYIERPTRDLGRRISTRMR